MVLFGGRDNDQKAIHIPKTYNVKSVNGTIVFTTYDEKPVSPCNDFSNTYYTVTEQTAANCNKSSTATSEVNIAQTYNDVWAYRLCEQGGNNSKRSFDGPCNGTGWELWSPGALQGGCVIELGIEVSVHSTEISECHHTHYVNRYAQCPRSDTTTRQ